MEIILKVKTTNIINPSTIGATNSESTALEWIKTKQIQKLVFSSTQPIGNKEIMRCRWWHLDFTNYRSMDLNSNDCL